MSTTVYVSDEVLESFPDLRIVLIVAASLDNAAGWPDADAAIDALEADAAVGDLPCAGEHDPAIASWHGAYRSFGTNPRRIRPSVDALQRRLGRHGQLPRINGAVNAYNATSARFCVPAGAFDIDQLAARVVIRFATAQDRFTPLGQPERVETPNVGEVVYAQGTDVLTRHWNHRDSHHTRVHEATRSAVFLLERVSPVISPERLLEARDHLVCLLTPHAANLATATLSAEATCVTLTDPDHVASRP
ncbi:MAG: B3/B4 domain-containing protein [Pseudonocardiaceae bacterium]